MRQNIDVAARLGYLNVKQGLVQDIKAYNEKKDRDSDTLIITTGSQGEPISSLGRISRDEHSQIRVHKGDTVVFSSHPIPGNEKSVTKVINSLSMKGVNIINDQMEEVHTSGHAKEEEHVRMLNYIKPKYLVPIHGEFYMRRALTEIAQERCAMKEDDCIIIQNGDIISVQKGEKPYVEKEPIELKDVLIDGRGEGHIGSNIIYERDIMSRNGVVTVILKAAKSGKLIGNPDIIARGFLYMHETQEITSDISKVAADAYRKTTDKNRKADRREIKNDVKRAILKYCRKKLDREPLILPLIVEL